jgi:signal transduction histidine kinase
LDQLFQRFYRTDPSRNSQTGGHGIGLSIAKAIVSAHRGKIEATSPDGVELKISAWIPLS